MTPHRAQGGPPRGVAGAGPLLGPRPAPARAILRTIGLLAREAPAAQGALLGAGLLPGLTAALAVVASRRLYAHLLRGEALLGSAAIYAAILLAQDLLGRAHGLAALRWSDRLQAAVRGAFLRRAGRLRLEALDQPEVADVLGRARDWLEGPRLVRATQHLFVHLPRGAFEAVGLAIGLAALNPWLAVAVVAAGVPTAVQAVRRGPAFYWFAAHRSRRYRALDYLGGLLSGRAPAAELRAYRAAPPLLARWRAEQEAVLAERAAFETGRLPGDLLAHLLGNGAVGFGLGLIWVVVLAARGDLAVATCAAALQALWQFQDAFRGVAIQIGNAGQDGSALADVIRILEAPAVERPAVGRPFPSPLREALALEEVTFTYPGRAEPALRGVTLRMRAGERVALVGDNGAGKTTAVRLLLGLCAPDEGRVTADGVPLGEIAPASLRAHTAAVFQDALRFSLPLRDNVALGGAAEAASGVSAGPRSDAAVRAALCRAGAGPVADALPQGLDTWLDPARPGGVSLSGGQWQRLAMARTAMRPDAALLVLDEPTAPLDPEAEAAVLQDLVAAAAGRTALFVSHRLGLARHCDRVVVLSAGRVLEEGTHDELLRRGGWYARMWETQAAWYR